MRTFSTHRATRAATTLAAAALLLTACTSDPEPTNTSTGSSSNSSTATDPGNATPTPSDQSSLVQGLTLASPQGTATGTVQRDKFPATLNVGTITAGPDSTILSYWLTGQPVQPLNDLSRTANWTAQPTLTDPAGKKIYQPLTYTRPDGTTHCLCTFKAVRQDQPQLRTIVYPPIPTSVTTVQVKMTGFPKPITAKLTRLP